MIDRNLINLALMITFDCPPSLIFLSAKSSSLVSIENSIKSFFLIFPFLSNLALTSSTFRSTSTDIKHVSALNINVNKNLVDSVDLCH